MNRSVRAACARVVCALAALAPLAAAKAQSFAPGQPILAVTDVELLKDIETAGYRFAQILGAPGADSLASLQQTSVAWRALSQTISSDVTTLRAEMKANGRPLFEVTDGNVGRVIDLRWLRSPYARMRLVGVVNRLDKRDFDATETCGETRLIYRMAYAIADPAFPKPLSSRMPFNINVVYAVPKPAGDDCKDAARGWIPQQRVDAKDRIAFLRNGALDLSRLTLKQIELMRRSCAFLPDRKRNSAGRRPICCGCSTPAPPMR